MAWLVAIDAAVLFVVPQLSTDRMAAVDNAPVEFLRSHLGLQRFYTFGTIAPNYGSYFGIASINQNDLPVPQLWSDYIPAHLDANTDSLLLHWVLPSKPRRSVGVRRVRAQHAQLRRDRNEVPRDQWRSADRRATGGAGPASGVRRGPSGDLRAARCRQLLPVRSIRRAPWSRSTGRQPMSRVTGRVLWYAWSWTIQGWSAKRDGASVAVSTYGEIFQSVEVPAGASRVTFRYAPRHIWLAWLAAALAGAWATSSRWLAVGSAFSRTNGSNGRGSRREEAAPA